MPKRKAKAADVVVAPEETTEAVNAQEAVTEAPETDTDHSDDDEPDDEDLDDEDLDDDGDDEDPDDDDETAAIEQRDREVCRKLAMLGIVISYQQLKRLPDVDLRVTYPFADSITAEGVTDKPIPLPLRDFATRELRQSWTDNDKPPSLPPKKYAACEFGGLSYKDGVIRLPVKVEADRLHPEEAHELLCGRKVEVVISRRTSGNADQPELFKEEELDIPRINGVVVIKRYSVQPKSWGFTLAFSEDDCTVRTASEFAGEKGRIELQVIGDAGDDEDDRELQDSPHPDVELGKDRPHGTPALDALATAAIPFDEDGDEQDPDDNDPHAGPATIPFVPPANSEKLFVCGQQLIESLKLINITLDHDESQALTALSDEVRDEIDTWAKVVAAHAAGQKLPELPPVPSSLVGMIPEEAQKKPVGYARFAGKSPLTWYCCMCEESWPSSKARKCPDCDASGEQDVVLVGFYNEPNCTIDGWLIGPEVAEFQVLPTAPKQWCSVRVVMASDNRWRAALRYQMQHDAGEDEQNVWPTIRDMGHTTRANAIESAIGKLIDRWGKLVGDNIEIATAALKEYLGRIASGADPLELEQELPEGGGE